jgi:hypothetical protein
MINTLFQFILCIMILAWYILSITIFMIGYIILLPFLIFNKIFKTLKQIITKKVS